MDFQKLEDEVMHLPIKQRVHLMQRLLSSLEAPSSEELRAEWLEEARRRAEELDSGSVQAVPGEDVLAKARALIK